MEKEKNSINNKELLNKSSVDISHDKFVFNNLDIILLYIVNPLSGSKEGKHFIELNKEYYKIKSFDQVIHCFIYNLINADSYIKAKKTLELLNNNSK